MEWYILSMFPCKDYKSLKCVIIKTSFAAFLLSSYKYATLYYFLWCFSCVCVSENIQEHFHNLSCIFIVQGYWMTTDLKLYIFMSQLFCEVPAELIVCNQKFWHDWSNCTINDIQHLYPRVHIKYISASHTYINISNVWRIHFFYIWWHT